MSDLKLWYDEPAREWVEALPIGNGRLGAMVFGGVAREHLQLNESTLWSGGPYSPVNPEALPNLGHRYRRNTLSVAGMGGLRPRLKVLSVCRLQVHRASHQG